MFQQSSGFCFVTFNDHTAPITAVQFLPNGHALVSASLDGTVRAFDLVRWVDWQYERGTASVYGVCTRVEAEHQQEEQLLVGTVELLFNSGKHPLLAITASSAPWCQQFPLPTLTLPASTHTHPASPHCCLPPSSHTFLLPRYRDFRTIPSRTLTLPPSPHTFPISHTFHHPGTATSAP